MQTIDPKSYELKSLQEFHGGVCECRAAFVLDEDEGGYTVVARNLPGVVSEGDDLQSSTFFRAQGVRRRNAKLDLILGSNKKHRIGICSPISAQP